ncbi:MAG: aminoacyl-tRNA hydrolase [Thermoleophilia bacterium]|nr:aminoacyl-tRNA hydrolase [Thermoleophilia bacterium]
MFKRGRGGGEPVDWLIVGLGNPGVKYAGTRHNVGYVVAERLIARYELSKPKPKYRGRLASGRLGPGGARVAVLMPGTYMNESGRSVGPARGELRVQPDHVVVIHDEIDFAFGRVETRLGGGTGGHNGLKSLKSGLGTADFQRVRVGVGRPDSSDPEIVSAWVLSGFTESKADVDDLAERALDATVRLVTTGSADAG